MIKMYRVTWVDPAWRKLRPSDPFHPLHVPVHRQGLGRFDNPARYAALYVSRTDVAAVGETFANLAVWPTEEITRTREDRPRCLVTYTLPDATRLLDLDDPHVLVDLAIRPSDVVRRNRSHTQELAARIWQTHHTTGISGLEWWSYWRPEWRVAVLWSKTRRIAFPAMRTLDVEPLTTDHPAVTVALDVLPRKLGRTPPKR